MRNIIAGDSRAQAQWRRIQAARAAGESLAPSGFGTRAAKGKGARAGFCGALAKNVVRDVIEIGKHLTEAKERVGHGNFLAWLESEFEWPERRARDFMTMYAVFGNRRTFADLELVDMSGLYKLAAPSTPESVRAEVIERAVECVETGIYDRTFSFDRSLPQGLRMWEVLMERRAFLHLLCIGMSASLVAKPVQALTSVATVASPNPALAPQRGVATPKDMDKVQTEGAYYGHWRRVGRRHVRRVSRRVYRRHYYY